MRFHDVWSEVCRQQHEGSSLKRRYGAEMALVETEQASRFIAFREHDDRAVGETEAEIGAIDVGSSFAEAKS